MLVINARWQQHSLPAQVDTFLSLLLTIGGENYNDQSDLTPFRCYIFQDILNFGLSLRNVLDSEPLKPGYISLGKTQPLLPLDSETHPHHFSHKVHILQLGWRKEISKFWHKKGIRENLPVLMNLNQWD